jgi:proteic killer suppression protein
MTIQSFKCDKTARLFAEVRVREFVPFMSVARRKLAMLHAALELRDLASPPGNRLEALQRDRLGQHSIRINDQFRVCFVWTDQGPQNVEIVDYH